MLHSLCKRWALFQNKMVMQLSLQTLSQIDSFRVQKPANNTLNLPERILQFGTGVLLRGLCDYYVNRANNKGSFNGRIVVVKSTSAGDMACFARQNNLYTVCVRGLSEGAVVSENIINASISRVLSASGDWEKVLELAGNPDLNIIISNTTEVGLQLTRESIHQLLIPRSC
jgi:tagaturonate reductase